MTHPVYVSTACLPGTEPLGRRLETLAAVGLTDVELGFGVQATPADIDALPPPGHGRRLLVHNYFPPPAESFVLNLASADDGVRAASIRLAVAAIALSGRLGAPFYSVHAGFVTDPDGWDGSGFRFPPPASPDETARAAERFRRSVGELLAATAESGVGLLIENNVCPPALRGKLLCSTADECVAMLGEIGSERVSLLLDTGHLRVSAATFGLDVRGEARTLARIAGAIHLHDNDGTADQHLPVEPDSWLVDLLRGPDAAHATVIVEAKLPSPGLLADHVHFLRRIGSR